MMELQGFDSEDFHPNHSVFVSGSERDLDLEKFKVPDEREALPVGGLGFFANFDDPDGLAAMNSGYKEEEFLAADRIPTAKHVAEVIGVGGFKMEDRKSVNTREALASLLSVDEAEESGLQEECLGDDLGKEVWDGYETGDDGRKFLVSDFYASKHETRVSNYKFKVALPKDREEEGQLDSYPIQAAGLAKEDIHSKDRKSFSRSPKSLKYGFSKMKDRQRLEPIRETRREVARSGVRRVLIESALLTGKTFTSPAKSSKDPELAAMESRYAEEIQNGGRSNAVLAAAISTLEQKIRGNTIR